MLSEKGIAICEHRVVYAFLGDRRQLFITMHTWLANVSLADGYLFSKVSTLVLLKYTSRTFLNCHLSILHLRELLSIYV